MPSKLVTRSAPSGVPDVSKMLAAVERGDALDLAEYRRRNPLPWAVCWYRPLDRDELLARIYFATGNSDRPPPGLYGATGLSLSAFGSRHRFVVTTSRRNWLELRRDAYCGNYSGDLKGYRQQIWLGELQTPQINGGAQ